MEKQTDTWPWPDELDALVAAPQHHRLLFENDKVRVLDTNIPPGEITALHTHRYAASLYILSWSDFVRYDADGNVIVDSKSMLLTPSPGTAMWTGPLAPHTLRNTGSQDLHVISVELKK